jgi:hypothetical protein
MIMIRNFMPRLLSLGCWPIRAPSRRGSRLKVERPQDQSTSIPPTRLSTAARLVRPSLEKPIVHVEENAMNLLSFAVPQLALQLGNEGLAVLAALGVGAAAWLAMLAVRQRARPLPDTRLRGAARTSPAPPSIETWQSASHTVVRAARHS